MIPTKAASDFTAAAENALVTIDRLPSTFDSDEQFEEIRSNLAAYLADYVGRCYLPEEVKTAKADRRDLNRVKKAIVEKRQENRRIALERIEPVQNKYKELEDMVSETIDGIGRYLSDMESVRKTKRFDEIRQFYDENSGCFGQLADTIFNSDGFLEPSWDNASCKTAKWQAEVKEKITTINKDLDTLQEAAGMNFIAVLNEYLRNCDLNHALEYSDELNHFGEPVSCRDVLESDECGDEAGAETTMRCEATEPERETPELVTRRLTLICTAAQWSDIAAYLNYLGVQYKTEIDG